MESFSSFFAYLAIASVAAERLTDIIKRSYLSTFKFPGYVYQIITFGIGVLLCLIQPPPPILDFNPIIMTIVAGLAVSGSSSVWHDIIEVISGYKKTLR